MTVASTSPELGSVLAGGERRAVAFPLVLTLTGLLAMTAAYFTQEQANGAPGGDLSLFGKDRFHGLIVVAFFLVLPHVVSARIPDRFLTRWAARLIAWGVILTFMGIPTEQLSLWYTKPVFMNRAAVLMAAEFVVRAWLDKAPGRRRRHFSEALLVTALIYVPATTAYEREAIRWITPFYVAAALLSARRIGTLTEVDPAVAGRSRRPLHADTAPPLPPLRSAVLRVVLILLVLGAGFGSVLAVSDLSSDMSAWAVQMLQGRVRRTSSAPEIGLSTTPVLRGVFNPTPSMQRVLVLEGVQGERHVRVVAYDRYNAGRWEPGINERTYAPLSLRELRPRVAAGAVRIPSRQVRVIPLDRNGSEYLAIPSGTVTLSPDVAVESDDAGTVRAIRGERVGQWSIDLAEGDDATSPLLIPPPPASPQASASTRGVQTQTDPRLARLLEVPPAIEPALVELAREIASGEGERERQGGAASSRPSIAGGLEASTRPAADETLTSAQGDAATRPIEPDLLRLYRLANYLRTHNRYSLAYNPSEKRDPVSEFVLEERAAHCQYFASAMVVMARAAGVPARYVTGFYAHEPTTALSSDGSESIPSTIVRDRDAHAWAECYIPGKGWIVVDATPSSGRPDATYQPPSGLRKMWEAIVDFPAVAREWLARGGLVRILLLSGGGAMFLLLVRFAFSRYRRQRQLRALASSGGIDPRLVELAVRFERELARLKAPASGTWRERARSVASSATFTQFLDAYDRARFGQDASAIPHAQGLFTSAVNMTQERQSHSATR